MLQQRKTRPSGRSIKLGGISLAALAALIVGLGATAPGALAQPGSDNAANEGLLRAEIDYALSMRRFHDADHGAQPTPPVIPNLETDFDASGITATQNATGPTRTATNPFFQNLGTNQRTCFTCHQPATGWTVSAQSVQQRFAASRGEDPIFRLVDGATCSTDDVTTLADKRRAYSLLLSKGLIRIALTMPGPPDFPDGPNFQILKVDDPYDCTTNPATGLTGPANGPFTTGTLSFYRRPLPSTNLGYLSTIMWDGREPSLQHQATDATQGHAQGNPLSTDQQNQIVAFETGLFTAQLFDNKAEDVTAAGAKGGPFLLAQQVENFVLGENDPFNPPPGTSFTSQIFDLYAAWANLRGHGDTDEERRSVARGEALFNDTEIDITGVAGINDKLGVATFHGFCGTCHDTPNVGDHSIGAPLDIGIADAGDNKPPAVDTSELPVFTVQCIASGPLQGKIYVVTDLGRAMKTNDCADIGKVKGPILRGLASRAPYFHNGSAATLLDVVNFYDQRFSIGFTDQQKQDLVAFLRTL